MFQKLPPELLQMVLDYASVIRRDGEYISRIEKTDPRYTILKTIPTKIITHITNSMTYDIDPIKRYKSHVVFPNHKGYITYYEVDTINRPDLFNFYSYTLHRFDYSEGSKSLYYIKDLHHRFNKTF
jgi:hypothetical protein